MSAALLAVSALRVIYGDGWWADLSAGAHFRAHERANRALPCPRVRREKPLSTSKLALHVWNYYGVYFVAHPSIYSPPSRFIAAAVIVDDDDVFGAFSIDNNGNDNDNENADNPTNDTPTKQPTNRTKG